MDTWVAFLNLGSGAAETVFAMDLSIRSRGVFSLNARGIEGQCFYGFN